MPETNELSGGANADPPPAEETAGERGVSTWPRPGDHGFEISSDPNGLSTLAQSTDLPLPYDEYILPAAVRHARNELVSRAINGMLPRMDDLSILKRRPGKRKRPGKPPSWARRLANGGQIAYDFVLSSYLDQDRPRFAVRLQSPGMIKPKALEAIKKDFQREFGADLIREVLRVGEIQWHARRAVTDYNQPDWGIGASISVSTGPPGRVTVFVRPKGSTSPDATHLLTAGHVLRDGAGLSCGRGEKLYHPAVSGVPGVPNTHVATLEMTTFRGVRARDALRGVSAGPIPLAADWGLLALERPPERPGDLPDGGTLSGLLDFDARDPLPLNTEVSKVRAATSRSRGRVRSASATVIFRNAAGVALAASGMIEIAGHGRPFSGDGDSGALVLGNKRVAIGLVVAGTTRGLFDGEQVGVSYALPLGAALSELGMELAI